MFATSYATTFLLLCTEVAGTFLWLSCSLFAYSTLAFLTYCTAQKTLMHMRPKKPSWLLHPFSGIKFMMCCDANVFSCQIMGIHIHGRGALCCSTINDSHKYEMICLSWRECMHIFHAIACRTLEEKMESFWPKKLSQKVESLKFDLGFRVIGKYLSQIDSILRVKIDSQLSQWLNFLGQNAKKFPSLNAIIITSHQ